jgi:hypothetical protein
MIKRHSWEKNKKGWCCRVLKKIKVGFKVIEVHGVKTCKHCGLRKGIQTGGTYMKWNNTIYFNQEGEVLSEERLPYECVDSKTDFLTKEDFYV